MNAFINSRFFYFLFPIYFSLVLILTFFNIPQGFMLSLLSLYFIATPLLLISKIFYPWKFTLDESYQRVVLNPKHGQMALFACFVILLSAPFDIWVNGFKLLDPLSYAEFNGNGKSIRHISSLCWILVPVSFIFVKSKKVKWIFVMHAIIFPILIVDRNRLFMAFYSLLFCMIAAPASKRVSPFYIYLLIFVLMMIFAVLGMVRSGDAFIVGSSGNELIKGAFPLNDLFYCLPELYQQIVLYLTSPIFNFATIVHYDFTNETFLLSQLSPFGREMFEEYPYAPVMIERFNVGTEYFPWLLYGGLLFVAASYFFIVLTFLWAVQFFKKYANIFTFLIFLRVSYVVLFSAFAPQFYLLLNLSFIVLMMFLWIASIFLGYVGSQRQG